MDNPVVLGAISWFLPGVGHMLKGKVAQGIIIAVVIWTMFIVAILSGGAYYPGFDFKDGQLLYLLNVFARAGNGLGAIIGHLLSSTPAKDIAALATFEYGGRFLEVAGLLNYLAVMDVMDLRLGRKK